MYLLNITKTQFLFHPAYRFPHSFCLICSPLWCAPGELLVVLQNQRDEDGGGQAHVDGAPTLIILFFFKKKNFGRFLWATNITHGLAVEYLRDEGYQGAEEGGQDANVIEGSDDF